jgi:predicted metal-dependent HD superfamily phosphohydrolase
MGESVKQLRGRWDSLWPDAAVADRGGVFDQLMSAYTGSDRHYHGAAHIIECLSEFDDVRSLASNWRAIEAAIWFHDVVYDGTKKDNEERSADFADSALGRLKQPEAFCAEVRRLILLTRHDHEPADIDGKLMVDIDLASLARSPEVFAENTRLIRLEYPHVNESEFARGRLSMLGRFLARRRIYYTDAFFDRYEKPARTNLQRGIDRMSGQASVS